MTRRSFHRFLVLLTGLVSAWFTPSAMADFRSEVLADNPLVYYEFEDVAGTTATDTTGSFNGTYGGGFTLGSTGVVGNAVFLDGLSGNIDVPNLDVLTPTFTLEMIMRPVGSALENEEVGYWLTDTYPEVTVTAGAGSATHIGQERFDGNEVSFLDTAGTFYETEGSFISETDFTHFVLVVDTVGDASQLYINGQPINDAIPGSAPWPPEEGPFVDPVALGDSTIGAWDIDGGGALERFFEGDFDEFALYGTALSQNDVTRHFNQTGLGPSLSLTINQDDGSIVLENISSSDVTLNSYSLLSAAGVFDGSNWNPIDGRDSAGDGTVDPNNDWVVTAMEGSELSENDGGGTGLVLMPGETVDLGTGVWRPFPDKDVAFVGDGLTDAPVRASVLFTGEDVLLGDITSDGVDSTPDGMLDENDWIAFQAGFGSDLEDVSGFDAYFLADLDGNGFHNFEDYLAFVTAFDEANGEGAFARMIPEPSGAGLLAMALCGMLCLRQRQPRRCLLILLAIGVVGFAIPTNTAHAAELARYTFDSGFMDVSGNGRDATPDGVFSQPMVMNGQAVFLGDIEESLIVPLSNPGDVVYPFDGTKDWTVEMTFNSTGNSFDPEQGVMLFGAFNSSTPAEPNYEGLSMFVDSGGELVVDYFFTGEVRASTGASLLDGMDHTMTVTYVAPDDPMDPESPGRGFINLDGTWYGGVELTPRQFDGTGPDDGCEPMVDCPPNQTGADFQTRIGTTFGFPLEEEAIEFQGTMDNVVIRDNNVAPTEFQALVDVATGEITFNGGEFARDIKYYEITSDGEALDPSAW
ncbi:MAG: LamG-like jellyroll fold domain-containing protein, partial [Planctomycetota bacterium]